MFFAKPPSKVEVINDTNRDLMNFYRVAKEDFVSLKKEIRISLHIRDLYRKASVIYNNPDMFGEIKRAWAVWLSASQSFSSQLDSNWGYDKQSNTTSKRIQNKKENIVEEMAIRLQNCQIECADALYIISSRDTENSFFYCDRRTAIPTAATMMGIRNRTLRRCCFCSPRSRESFCCHPIPRLCLKNIQGKMAG